MSYIYDLADTWNSAGTTFNAIKMNVTDTASAAGSLLMDLQVGGSSKFSVTKAGGLSTADGSKTAPAIRGSDADSGFFYRNSGNDVVFSRNGTGVWSIDTGNLVVGSSGFYSWSSGEPGVAGADLVLARDAANTLAQRNGVNAQTFRLYNTYTDASNYERLGFVWSGNTLQILTERAGTGTSRDVQIGTQGTSSLYARTNNTDRWRFTENGHLFAHADNTYDIGASGANRPRNLYVAGIGVFGGYVYAAPDSGLGLNGRAYLVSGTAGVIRLSDWTGTSFDRLQFGGTTSAYPSLKRNGAVLQLRLADDSSSADLTAAQITANASTAMPAGGAITAGVKMSTTANFGVFFGSGAPTLSAAKGSLYLRSDGTTTNDRMYVNTDGATTWTAVTTAA